MDESPPHTWSVSWKSSSGGLNQIPHPLYSFNPTPADKVPPSVCISIGRVSRPKNACQHCANLLQQALSVLFALSHKSD